MPRADDFEGSSSGGESSWEDAEPEHENLQIVSLFDNQEFSSVKSMFKHCKEAYDFDILALQQRLDLDLYEKIKLVNYIRSEVKKGNKVPDVSSKKLFQQDSYLTPVLENDALLYAIEEYFDENTNLSETDKLKKRVEELEEELENITLRMTEYQNAARQLKEQQISEADTGIMEVQANKSVNQEEGASNVETQKSKIDEKYDEEYFDSYSWNDIHETMLKDTVRTDAYRDFIFDNKNLFDGKIVLDVGCGTGILSMFCARAGATVFAIDNSNIIEKARANVQVNGLEKKITCIKGKMEKVNLPVKEVDIIISEWMGYCLLYEAMLPSVLSARDRYLKKDGLMVPSHCVLHLAPFSDGEYMEERFGFWRDVYGFDMKAMAEDSFRDAANIVPAKESIQGPPCPFFVLDLHEIKEQELEFSKPFELRTSQPVYNLDGFDLWFDTFFLPSRHTEFPLSARAETWKGPGNAFTTGPYGQSTHWRTGLLLIDKSKHTEKPLPEGTVIKGTIGYEAPSKRKRAIQIEITWEVGNQEYGQQMWNV